MTARKLRIEPEDICSPEWAEWYRLTPQERWRESEKLWQNYLAFGGSLDPEPDTQSPFYFADEAGSRSADGRSGVRLLRRGGV
jgi:hypothetical protein